MTSHEAVRPRPGLWQALNNVSCCMIVSDHLLLTCPPWGPATRVLPTLHALLLPHCCLQGSFCLNASYPVCLLPRRPSPTPPLPCSLPDASSWSRLSFLGTPTSLSVHPSPPRSPLFSFSWKSGNLHRSLSPPTFRGSFRIDTGLTSPLSLEPRGQVLHSERAAGLSPLGHSLAV